ncbi:hypothetical protein M2129_001370 [Polynucleobacter sphagniphilus]|nr:hypothetical protein [Polynucleobacter sphagniphilus]MDH6300926.1 hypothetical protein [Polynucleobacter sphagniphilus]
MFNLTEIDTNKPLVNFLLINAKKNHDETSIWIEKLKGFGSAW